MGTIESELHAGGRTRRQLERELAGKGYRRSAGDPGGTFWKSPDGRKRLYLDDIGIFFYLRNGTGWRRLWGCCWGNLVLNDLMI